MGSRHWCLTLWVKPDFSDNSFSEKIRYGIFGEEICPSTNKTHWQSYVELPKVYRISGLKKLFNDKTLHAEKRQGDRDQARDYCKKDGKYTEIGDWNVGGQGNRTDIKAVVKEMQEGKPLEDVMMEHPQLYCQYRNGFKDISAKITKDKIPKWRNIKVTILSGPTGVGKTRGAMELNPFKVEGSNMKWWCGYSGEGTLLIDEYNNDVSATELINILDGYPLKLNIKGGHTWANWTRVFITTNLKIDEFHINAKDMHRQALFRRLEWWNMENEICNKVIL